MDPAVRERLLETALIQFDEKGHDAMSLEDLLRVADVAEEDFGAAYDGLDTCLADAYEWLTIQLEGAVQIECAIGGGQFFNRKVEWPTRVHAGLKALLSELAASPELARVLTRSYPALGPDQQARYHAFLESLAAKLRACRRSEDIENDLPQSVDSLAIGAAEAIVFEEIAAGRTAALPALVPSILFSILVPYLGAAEATSEMEKARTMP